MSDLLQGEGWNSTSYVPFFEPDLDPQSLGTTTSSCRSRSSSAFPIRGCSSTRSQRWSEPDGIVCFSTLVTETGISANQHRTWWDVAPRNGHISLYTRDSLARLGMRQGFRFGGIDSNLHT
jgi:hypothetical protein